MRFAFELFLKPIYVGLLPAILPISSVLGAEPITPTEPLTLQTALNLAMHANPEIAVALREREAIQGAKLQATAQPNPTVSTSIQDTRSDTRQIYLQVNQELELGNKREARIQAADMAYQKANAELEVKKADIHANVVAMFYEVLATQTRLELGQSSLEVARLGLDAASKRVRAGKSAPVEEIKSRIAESNAKIEASLAESQLNSARKRLAGLWGGSDLLFSMAEGQVSQIPKIPELADLVAMLANAPIIRAAQIEVSVRDGNVKIEDSKTIPNITLSAGVLNNQELGLNQALMGISVPIPVFDRNQGNLQEAVSRHYKAQDELIALKSRSEGNLVAYYERLRAARLAVESLQIDILPAAQSAFDAASKGFSAGKFSFLEVLDAQRTLFQAKSQYILALLDAHQAIAEIERILGDVVTHSIEKEEE